jgi:hypothetical protein
MIKLLSSLRKAGYQDSELLIDESAPDHCVQLQAEVMNDPNFVYMRYAVRSGLGMRQAYPTMKHAYGATAMRILRHFLDCESIEELERILCEYSNDTVVELSSYPIRLGRLNWNTIFWEVRSGY